MKQILNLSMSVNWGYSTNNNDLFVNSATQLYNYVQSNGARLLTTISESSDLQMIGKAFSYLARFIDCGDIDISSVASENAYYCLSKSIINGNYYASQELFNLLHESSELLLSKFISARMKDIQKETGLPVFVMYGNPLKTTEGKEEGRKIIPYVKFYIISKFYDIESNKSLIPTDMQHYSQSALNDNLQEISKIASYNKLIETGSEYFLKVYLEIKDTLMKY